MRYGSNAVFNRQDVFAEGEERSSMRGVATKAVLILSIAIVVALLCMNIVKHFEENELAMPIVIVGYLISPILTMIFTFIISFRPRTAKALSIPYAILEGISIGAICGLLKYALGEMGGVIVGLAFVVTLTFFLAATVLYMTGLVKVGSGFRRFGLIMGFGLIASTMMILIAGIFNHAIYELFYSATPIGILFALIGVLVASIYTLITLDNAKRMVEAGLAATYEWYCAFGIVLNIVWLFWEVLRLVVLITSRMSRR